MQSSMSKLILVGTAASKEACAQACSARSNCRSFGYSAPEIGQTAGTCDLYNDSVNNLNIAATNVAPAGQSLQGFFDITCFGCGMVSPTTSSTSTSADLTTTSTPTPNPVQCTRAQDTPSGAICGQAGVATEQSQQSEVPQGMAASIEECARQCADNGVCLSFAYSEMICTLYSSAVSDLDVVGTSGVPQEFYDLSCAPPLLPTESPAVSRSGPD